MDSSTTESRSRQRERSEPAPPGLPTRDLSRRSFLELLGFSVAAAGCSRSPVREAIPFVDKPQEMMPGEALWYATTCGGCAAGCGVLVKARDGRAIKIEGNPESPVGSGGTCAVGQASVLGLYDEARVRGPLWQGEPSSWPEIDRRIKERLAAIAAQKQRVVLLSGGALGPSTEALVRAWCEHYPGAQHVDYEPVSSAAIRHAHELAYGVAGVPRYRFDRAQAIVGLDADFLGTWLSPVSFTRSWAQGRRPPAMSWHAQFEARLSPTGAKADLRVPVRPSELGAVALALYARLAQTAERTIPPELASRSAGGVDDETLDRVASMLWRRRESALVVCGVNDPELQLLVAAINDLLGSIGTTVELGATVPAGPSDDAGLVNLVEDMRGGKVHGLIVYGANPVYETAFGTEFAEALQHVTLTISLGDRLDESARLVTAVCPDHHPLESWRDSEPVRGLRTLAQPAMRPIFDTRAAQASLLAWMGGEADWYGYLRDSWMQASGRSQDRSGFESFWNQSVHDGWAEFPSPPADAPRPFAGDLGAAASILDHHLADGASARNDGRLELILYQKAGLRDGRLANNPWLQELPDPISRATWSNYAAMAPELADRLGIADEDIVRLEADGRSLEIPALRQIGQAPDTVAVALGYGRRNAGKAADGIGSDVYPFVRLEGGFSRLNGTVSVTRLERSQAIPRSQRHDSLEGRPIIKETTLEQWHRDPNSGNDDRPEPVRLWPEREAAGRRWGMSIDLNACVGCAACVVACQAENNVPVVGPDEAARGREMHWIRIDRYYSGPDEQPDTAFQPMMCQHCADAPCESVCPVLATVHSSDGLNQQVYNRCIGTRYCANNCPYKVRRFNWFNYAKNDRFDYHMNDDLGTLVLNPDVVVRSRGVMEKCSMCIQRIQAGTLESKVEGRELRDGDIQTACQEACPAGAIVFGDLEDDQSRVAIETRDPRFYHVLEELGTGPAVGYLTVVRDREATDEGDRPTGERA